MFLVIISYFRYDFQLLVEDIANSVVFTQKKGQFNLISNKKDIFSFVLKQERKHFHFSLNKNEIFQLLERENITISIVFTAKKGQFHLILKKMTFSVVLKGKRNAFKQEKTHFQLFPCKKYAFQLFSNQRHLFNCFKKKVKF